MLREQIGPDFLAEAVARNQKETSPGVCHTHDYCDSNMAMVEALGNLGAQVYKPGSTYVLSEEGLVLWNAAWDLAKARGFFLDEHPRIAVMVGGKVVSSLADFLAANADDGDVCEWARSAQPGDRYPALIECVAVAASPAAVKEQVLQYFYDNEYIPDLDPEEYSDAQVQRMLRFLRDGQHLTAFINQGE